MESDISVSYCPSLAPRQIFAGFLTSPVGTVNILKCSRYPAYLVTIRTHILRGRAKMPDLGSNEEDAILLTTHSHVARQGPFARR